MDLLLGAKVILSVVLRLELSERGLNGRDLLLHPVETIGEVVVV